jgi:hypothetical protein
MCRRINIDGTNQYHKRSVTHCKHLIHIAMRTQMTCLLIHPHYILQLSINSKKFLDLPRLPMTCGRSMTNSC